MCLVLSDGSAYVTVTSVANEHASLTQYSYRFLADEGRNFSFRFVRGAKQTHAAPRDAGTVPESILRAEDQLAALLPTRRRAALQRDSGSRRVSEIAVASQTAVQE
jgi:hypothetical protein